MPPISGGVVVVPGIGDFVLLLYTVGPTGKIAEYGKNNDGSWTFLQFVN